MNYKSLERVFGSLKFIKVLTLLYFYNVIFMGTLLFLCYAVLRINIYIPSGPFGILFGLLYPYFKFAPTLYSFELDFGGLGKSQHNNDNDNNDNENENEYGNDIEESSGNSEKYRLTFTNNFVTAILAVQLLLSEGFISSPIACLVGYFVSSLLFSDVLPLLNSRFFILDSLYTRWTRKPSEGRQQSLDAHIQNLAANSEEQDLPASGNASISVGESSRSLTPPENVERAVEDQEENEQDTDIPARSLGTQLLDTFRR
ncbi:DEKNAAC100799 [Brettanomyces naardenensis]|uniref:DEKNAAC100799 n=1 Tax=Brettanomyces naardenensis TaxID=13370 RepID=A0A448YFQ4_BRENA|nr:DEKNAAC100799 [Brettanomyces naardenensis]